MLIAESLVNNSKYVNIYVYLNEECSMSSFYNFNVITKFKGFLSYSLKVRVKRLSLVSESNLKGAYF